MKTTRFQILCSDRVWRFIFCRSLNTTNLQTFSSLVATESKDRAFVAYGEEYAAKSMAYFTEYANGAPVRFA
jgi:hypothetical protein